MKVVHAVRNSEVFRIWSKSFNVSGSDAQAKINFFPHLTLLSNNLLLTSYLSCIYLESWFYWLCNAENIE